MEQRRFISLCTSLLQACNYLLDVAEKKHPAHGLHVVFAKSEPSSYLRGLFMKYGIRGRYEGKGYCFVDMVFPFVVAFVDRCKCHCEEHNITERNIRYSDIFTNMSGDGASISWT